MNIKKSFFAPLASGLGATRRAAVLLLVMLCSLGAWADNSGSCGDNVTYSYVESTHTLTISGTGAMEDYEYSYDRPWDSYVYQIKTIVIENGVTSIGKNAFYNCELSSIDIPTSVTSIGMRAFSCCYDLTTVTIPASVTSIGTEVFTDCSNIETMTVAAGNTVYDSRDNCNAIIEIATNTLIFGCKNSTIPASVTSIGNFAFYGCSDLTSIDIPAGVTSIGAAAFGGCKDLSMVTFAPGSQLTTIGEGAFSNCKSLGSITIPASVTSIGKEVFTYCSNLATITVETSNTVYDSRNGCHAIIETSSNKLIAGCKNSTIPDDVTSIGDNAFDGHGPATVTIPASVTTIGEAAFEASGLTTVTFATDSKLTTIGNVAFHDNPLGSITIPASVTTIGTMAFYDCRWLATVTFDGTQTLTTIGDYAFSGQGLTTITIPASVTSIGDEAFHDCTGLKSVMLNGEATIGWGAFPNGAMVTIAEGMLLHNGTEPLSGNVSDMGKLNGKTLKTAYSVTFDIADDDNDPEAQIVVRGNKATVPTVARTGYTLKWKVGEAEYDFDTPVNSNITLTAVWTANNYTVQFSANGGSGDAMASMQLTYDGDWATLPACTYIAPEGKAFKNWNTAADGSGAQYEDKDWVRNLTDEPNGTVVLYAQWGKNIATCTATVPGQTLDGNSYIYYKFESANNGNADTGTTVYDGKTLLTVGTDYVFDQVYFYGTENSCTDVTNKVGDHFTVVIKGIGNYAGTTTADFYIISPEVKGEWGDLAWTIDADGNFTISKKDGVEGNVAMNETTKGNYPWYDKAGYIKTITIGEGITTVAANAFCRETEMNVYGNVHSLTLPESLTSIGEFAFAYCTALNINLTVLEGITFPATAFSYINSLTGTLYDNADNTKTISVMAQVSKNNVTLSGRTLYKDGDLNTLCLPFDVSEGNSILDGATVKELDVENYYDANGESYTKLDYENAFRTGFDAETGTLRLYFKNVEADGSGVVLQAGKPYLIKWDKAEGYDDADPATRDITGDLVFLNAKLLTSPNSVTSSDNKVSFVGTYGYQAFTEVNKSILLVGTKNSLYYPLSGASLGAFRAYFQLNGDVSGSVKMFFGEEDDATSLSGELRVKSEESDNAVYDLSGRKVNSQFSILNSRRVSTSRTAKRY